MDLMELGAELGTDRMDVCGQRFVEVRAWELAWERAADVVARGGEGALIAALTGELEPLVEAVNEASRRPRAALWRGASDRVAQALMLAGEEMGAPERGEAAARRALAVRGPLAGTLRVAAIAVAGEIERLQIRNGCCLWHRIPGEAKCSNCPLLDPADRGARLLAEREESG
jgi:FhuF 2Fe-2S C-terminal domain